MKQSLKVRLLTAVFAAAICLSSAAYAAVDMFLKIEGVEGTSRNAPGAIDVLAYSWGVSNGGSTHVGGGAGAGKANVQDLSFTCATSKATPKLAEACVKGTHFPQATLTVRKSGGGKGSQEYLEIKMEDLLVSSYSTGGSENDTIPLDNFSLNFAKLTFTFVSGGEAYGFTYNIAENTTE